MRRVRRAALTAAAALLGASAWSGDAAAAPGTLTYLKDGNVYVSPADGSATAQITRDASPSAPYLSGSQSDAGVVVAVRSDAALRFAQSGQQLAPPVGLDGATIGGGVSPDGATLAYGTVEVCGIVPRACNSTYFVSLQTGRSVLAKGEQMTNATWAGNAEVVGVVACGVYRTAPGRVAFQPWINLSDLTLPGCVEGAAATADGTRIAASVVSGATRKLFLLTAAGFGAPATWQCSLDLAFSGPEAHPVWSPDGTAVAWERADGVWTQTVVDLSGTDAGCEANSDTARLVVPGAVRPTWSAAAYDPGPVTLGTPPPRPAAPGAPATPGGSRPGAGGRAPSGDAIPPTSELVAPASSRLRGLLRGLKVSLTCSETAAATAVLSIDARTARSLRLRTRGRPRVTIATGRASCARGRRITVTLKPGRRASRGLRRARRAVKARLRVAVVDPAGNRGSSSARLTFRL